MPLRSGPPRGARRGDHGGGAARCGLGPAAGRSGSPVGPRLRDHRGERRRRPSVVPTPRRHSARHRAGGAETAGAVGGRAEPPPRRPVRGPHRRQQPGPRTTPDPARPGRLEPRTLPRGRTDAVGEAVGVPGVLPAGGRRGGLRVRGPGARAGAGHPRRPRRAVDRRRGQVRRSGPLPAARHPA
ncbi:hypothetical protein SDC9_99017 [bioreactor metagenome]|uniref:Uncharacterized protein n=1 Tax=bioreactor metagenome TaxID=1076179 RepID=A0A645AGD3_9ZZZZ